jgi:hypothetical protein
MRGEKPGLTLAFKSAAAKMLARGLSCDTRDSFRKAYDRLGKRLIDRFRSARSGECLHAAAINQEIPKTLACDLFRPSGGKRRKGGISRLGATIPCQALDE